MKRLVVSEFVVEDGMKPIKTGEKFSCFVDPETGRYYRPVEGFEVTGEDLSDRFVEVIPE